MTTSLPRPLKEWEEKYAERIVQSVNAVREKYEWTIPQLRAELEPYGWVLSLETLNGILSSRKRKSFTVGEVFCFARALRVPPEFLILGLPMSAPLPEGPVVPDPSSAALMRWMRGANDSVYRGSPLSVVERYGRLLSDIKRENAMWHITGEKKPWPHGPRGEEVGHVEVLLDQLSDHLDYWRRCEDAGLFVPDLPEVPAALQPYVGDSRIVPSEPVTALLDDELIDTVRQDIKRLAEAQADVERMKRRSDGASSDSSG